MEQMLIQSEKMASIGILAAGIAHEINNPVGYINSNLKTLEKYNEKFGSFYNSIQTLIDECSDNCLDKPGSLIEKFLKFKDTINYDYLLQDMKDAVQESLEGTEKVKRIVSDLKDFAREEKPEMKPANVNDAIKKTLNVIRNEIKYKAEVIKEFGDIPEIECDIQRLEQVFMNVLINAAQAIEKKGTIKIKTFSADSFVVIQITDTGTGIPEKNIGKILEPFYTTKGPGKGTGIGLSISLKIIQEHNGTINVESKVGKGTTFTIKLPVKDSEKVKEYKVLIIDDDEPIRKLLKKMVNEYSPSLLVKTAKDGFEAADILHSFIPDVVLLDINMPGMDGFEVCRRIKDNEKMIDTRIVMITGLPHEDLKEKSYKAGACEFFLKPIKLKTLYGVLDKIIKDK